VRILAENAAPPVAATADHLQREGEATGAGPRRPDLRRDVPADHVPRRGVGGALFAPLAMSVVFTMLASYLLSRTLLFTSLACNGVFIGQIVAESIGQAETGALPLLGAACFLSAGYRLPLACMLFVGEASGSLAVAVAGLAVIAIGEIAVGDASVSDAQVERRPG
jgi:H+/Cl- antiporter ClcA